ncbi:hypothetical protein Q0M94_12165 [Deinococcus radiomollis]|uniref:hypothetical protein n=1 Tax=Deinococcus radiomollis TaxID=468916 RepID=UPI003892CB44
MVNHRQRFWMGITLILLGLVLTFVAGDIWILRDGLPYGLLTLLGVGLLATGALLLLRHKRSR